MTVDQKVDRLYEEAIRCKETAIRLMKARCYPLAFRYTEKGKRLAEEAIRLSDYK